jgi:hypothetical protein
MEETALNSIRDFKALSGYFQNASGFRVFYMKQIKEIVTLLCVLL